MSNASIKLNHVHAKIRDLGAAVSWFETMFGLTPTHRDDRLAVFSWESFSLLLDASDVDSTLTRSEEHTSELQSRQYLVCRLLLEKKKKKHIFHLQSSTSRQWTCLL